MAQIEMHVALIILPCAAFPVTSSLIGLHAVLLQMLMYNIKNLDKVEFCNIVFGDNIVRNSINFVLYAKNSGCGLFCGIVS